MFLWRRLSYSSKSFLNHDKNVVELQCYMKNILFFIKKIKSDKKKLFYKMDIIKSNIILKKITRKYKSD